MICVPYRTKRENITGEEVREIIIKFEEANGIESKVEDHTQKIEEELRDDAKMTE